MHRRPHIGQHFLKEASLVKTIADLGVTKAGETILEIGPGEGVLTRALLDKKATVIAVEKDKFLVESLKVRFKDEISQKRLTLIEGDIRDFDPGRHFKSEKYSLVANIPYYLTGEILKSFIGGNTQPKRAVLLVQKEVAERILAKDRKESILSISIKAYGEPKYVKTVKKGSFKPPPRVDSAILLIENISRNYFKNLDEGLFFNILKRGFAHKRKKLVRNLKMEEADLEKIGLEKNIRPEDLSLGDWKKISSL